MALNHAKVGPHSASSSVFKLLKCLNNTTFPALLLGEHNEYVLKNILELSDDGGHADGEIPDGNIGHYIWKCGTSVQKLLEEIWEE
ncbi:MAG: hypothetical protein SWO11_09545 [Thermodesulfobacteriota bacterium]|nr:hypothetical protein [Thermodesulfobacteriota bacterium]